MIERIDFIWREKETQPFCCECPKSNESNGDASLSPPFRDCEFLRNLYTIRSLPVNHYPRAPRSSHGRRGLANACIAGLIYQHLHQVFVYRFSIIQWVASFEEVVDQPVQTNTDNEETETTGNTELMLLIKRKSHVQVRMDLNLGANQFFINCSWLHSIEWK